MTDISYCDLINKITRDWCQRDECITHYELAGLMCNKSGKTKPLRYILCNNYRLRKQAAQRHF